MKLAHYLIFHAALALFTSSSISIAQDDPFADTDTDIAEQGDGKPRQIRIYTESYEVSAMEYAKLMTIASHENNHGELRNSLLAKAKKGEAVLLDNHSLTTISAERATMESVREFIYPVENTNADGSFNNVGPGGNSFPVVVLTPTAFQTINLGNTLQIGAILSDRKGQIDLSMDLETVEHVGDHVFSTTNTSYVKSKESGPMFFRNKVQTSFTIMDGEFMLMNTFSPELEGEIDHSRKILNFVRAEVLGFGE
jgi:hypothetical protein